MPRQISVVWKRISDTVRGFSFAQKTLTVLGVLVLVLGGVGLAAWLTRPNYVPLFSGISASDASAISDQLHTDNVPYQLSDGGSTILVPETDVYAARLKAAGAGLPAAPNQGYSLLDNMGVTTSQFQETVTYQRAMEGELANTIDAMNGVTEASVKLAIPQQTVFTDKQQDPTASVFVKLTPGTTLSSGQVQAIVHLVSASTVGMKPTDVSVVDSAGNTLSAVGGNPAGGAAVQASSYDSKVQNSVQQMLDKVLGPGNSTIVVSAVINAATMTKTTKTQTVPSGAPASSTSEQKQTYTGSGTPGSLASGLLGTTTTTTGSSGTGSYTSDNLVKDNALNSVTEKQQIPAGSVTDQSISVAVNRSAASASHVGVNQIKALVAAAAGVNTARGDALSVQLVNFSTANALAAKQALAQANAQARATQIQQWIQDGSIALGVILAGLAVAFLVRRARRSTGSEVVPIDFGNDFMTSEFTATPVVRAQPEPLAAAAPAVGSRRSEIQRLAEDDPQKAAEYLRGLMGGHSA